MFRIFSYISFMCMYKGANKTEKMISNIDYILNYKIKIKVYFVKKTFFCYKTFHLQVEFLNEVKSKIDSLLCTIYYYG